MTGVLLNPTFQTYRETIFLKASSGPFVANCATGNNFALTLSSGSNSISFINVPATGALFGANFYLTQDGTGNRTVSWPSTVSWGNPGVPVLSTTANATDIVNMITYTGGSKWLGFLSGRGF